MTGVAGGSADREYRRRRRKERARLLERLPRTIALVVVAGVAAYGGTYVAVDLLDNMNRRNTPVGAPAPPPMVPADSLRTLALIVGGAASWGTGRLVWGRRQTTEAWRIGAEGERTTADALRRLEHRGFITLHDRTLPGRRANIDHIVVGPTGVFTIETKNFGGKVSVTHPLVGGPSVRHKGRDLGPVIDQARAQSAAVDRLLVAAGHAQTAVQPVVCLAQAALEVGWLRTPVVSGVRWSTARDLPRVLHRGPKVLTAEAVSLLVTLIDDGLSHQPHPSSGLAPPQTTSTDPCSCGAAMVVRHRRADGEAFLGCSRFPACRQSRPLG